MNSQPLPEVDICLDLITKGKQSALSKIAIRIARRNGLNEQLVLRSLIEREYRGSTGIGRGVAIPHAVLDTISSPVASLSRLAQPIDFEGPDDDPVDLIYTVLWPRSAASEFLPALSQICRLLRASQVRERLRLARSSDEALATLEGMPRQGISTTLHTSRVGLGTTMVRQFSNAQVPCLPCHRTLEELSDKT
ncbi:PTS sugar transporter subunit IIA [Mesorhizobium sp. ESP7-2]|uniref:PTS sugar transporter subunit IIA n=1 Tax=Mesorhizobium sp. ESP7-2 TaxID=2876622 RepID=UPI001CC91A2F|nr:PTS sugar transporter subunit IIA [Mesorhizobium sp. ESP7-2]MBZ9708546.1 PTS sugar transporter subunit IIA [Mesorhizobium sp. ESP7-2]